MMDQNQTASMSPEETKRVEAGLATSIQLYKSGNLVGARNALLTCMQVIGKVSSKLGSDVMQKLVAIDYDLGDKTALVADLKSLASYFMSVGFHDKAVTALQTATAIDPDDSQIQFLLAKTVVASGDLPLGLPMLRKVVETEQSNTEALELFIRSSLKFRPDQALPYVQKYLDKNDDNPAAYADAAVLFEQLGLTTEAVNIRQKASEKIKDPKELKDFLSTTSFQYPMEPYFHGKLLEIAIDEGDVQKIDSELSQLVRIMNNKEDWRSALGFIELRLLVDPRNRSLIDEAGHLRSKLGYSRSPLDFDEKLDPELIDAKRNLLFMDWTEFLSELTSKLQKALDNGNTQEQLRLRREWLKVSQLKQIIADRLEGSHKMPDELWAQLIGGKESVEDLKQLYKRFPTQLTVVKSLLSKLGNDRHSINTVWLDMAGRAAKVADWEAVSSYISLLSSTNETLAPFIGSLKPIISETLR